MKSQRVEIINDCSGLPRGAVRRVQRALAWIHPPDLSGLSYVKLIDKLPDVKDMHPDWYKEGRVDGRGINGWYNYANKTDHAGVVLHLPDLFRGVPSSLWWTTAPTLLITRVLAHEVAHHLQYTRGYVFARGESQERNWQIEGAADRYAYDLRREMLKKWSYWLGHEAIQMVADVYYRTGVKRWHEKNYARAADYWRRARDLDSDHYLAAHWYWRARERVESGQRSIQTKDDVLH